MGVGLVLGAVVGGATFAAGSAFFGATMLSSVVMGAALGSMFDRKNPVEDASPTYGFGELRNTFSQYIPVPIIYGRVKVAGNIIYHRVSDDDSTLVMAVGLGEGEIEAVEQIYVNDTPIEDIEGVQWDVYLGTSDQAADSRVLTGERFKHTAYIVAQFSANDQVSSTPTISAVVKGLKVPVKSDEGWDDVYTENPAWCLLDLLRNPRYGLGIPDDRLDLDSFATEAAYCDELVDVDGGQEARFRLGYIIDAQNSSLDVIDDLLASFRAFLLYSEGKVRLQVERSQPTVYAFGMDNIIADSFVYSKASYKDTPNQIRVEWIDPDSEWERVESVYDNEPDQERRGEIYSRTISAFGVTRPGQAGRLARFYHDSAFWANTFCEFRVGIDALMCEVGDVVAVSHDVPGWTGKLFRILEITEDENDEMGLRCREYVPAIYHDRGSAYQPGKQTTLPDPLSRPDYVTDLALESSSTTLGDGTVIPSIKVTWTEPDDLKYFRARVYWQKEGDGGWTFAGTSESTVFQIPLVGPGNYTVLVQSESRARIRSPFISSPQETISINSDVPPNVSGLVLDFTGPDVLATWGAVSGATSYRVKILSTTDQVMRTVEVSGTTYRYGYQTNVADFGGNGSPTLKVSVEAKNDYGNYSPVPAVLQATNLPPAEPVVTGDSSLRMVRWTVSSALPLDFSHLVVSVGTYTLPTPAPSGVVDLEEAGVAPGTMEDVTVQVVDVFGQAGDPGTVQITARYLAPEDIQGELFSIEPTSEPDPSSGSLEDLWDMDTTTGVTFASPPEITFIYPVEQGSDLVRVHLGAPTTGYVQMKRAHGETWVDVLGSAAEPVAFTSGWNVKRFTGNKLYFGKEYKIVFEDAVQVNELKFWRVTLADEVLAQALKLTGEMKIENENGSVVIDSTSMEINGVAPATQDDVDELADGERQGGTLINGRQIVSPTLVATSDGANQTIVSDLGLQFVREGIVTRYFSGVHIGEAVDGGTSVELPGFVNSPQVVLMPTDLIIESGKRLVVKPTNIREESGVWKFDIYCRTYTVGTLFTPAVGQEVREGQAWTSAETDPVGKTTNRLGVKMTIEWITTAPAFPGGATHKFDIRVVRKNMTTEQTLTSSWTESRSFGSGFGHNQVKRTLAIHELNYDVDTDNWQLSVHLDNVTNNNGNWTIHDAYILVEYWIYSSDSLDQQGKAQYIAFDGG